MSGDQNAGRSQNVKTDNSSFDMVEDLKYLRTKFRIQNSMQEEIKSRLKSGTAFYHSKQNLLSSGFLFRNAKIKIYKIIILPVF
jgi:hypothetical protein